MTAPTRPTAAAPVAATAPVCVVIPHLANLDDTLACLRSLAEVDWPELTVIVVSNGARDLDPAALRAALPSVELIESPVNLGFAGGVNLGITRAMAGGVEAILLLNNDTVVAPSLIGELWAAFDDPEVGIAGPTIVYHDRPERVWFRGGRYARWLGYTFHPGMDRPLDPSPPLRVRRTDFITGCALLVRRAVIERSGPLWDDLFLYFEDAEFCLRAGQAGFRCALVDRPLVRHKVSSTAGRRGTNRFSPDQAYYFARNPLLMAQRLGGRGWLLHGGLGFLGVIAPIYCLRLLAARDRRALAAYGHGLGDGLRRRSGKRPDR